MSKLTPLQLDALGESGNIAMGAAATALSELLGHKVDITAPEVTNTTMEEIGSNYNIPCVLVRVKYVEGIIGANLLILSDRDAGVIANMMMGDADLPLPEKLDEMYLSAVSEAMNQMMGSSATALSEMFNRRIDITPPELEYIEELKKVELQEVERKQQVVLITFKLIVGNYINSKMLQVLPLDFAHAMVQEMMGGFDLDLKEPVLPAPTEETIMVEPAEVEPSLYEPPVIEQTVAEPVVPEPAPEPPEAPAKMPADKEPLVITPVETPAEKKEAIFHYVQEEGKVPLELLRDIPVRITGVLGRTRMLLRDLMAMDAGTTIELNTTANDPVEIVANGRIVARGEIVLYKENLGIRITELCN